MKNWLKRNKNYIAIIFIFFIALNSFYSGVQNFVNNRSQFEVIYRWELSSFYPSFFILAMGLWFFFDEIKKEHVANLVAIILGSILFIMGIPIMFVFDNNIGFFSDVLLMFVLSGLLIGVGLLKLSTDQKSLITKKQLKRIDRILSICVFLIILTILILILSVYTGG